MFQLTSEQEMVRLMARDFAKKELEPYARERDKNETFPVDVIKKMGELGLMGMMVPPEFGGSGAGTVSYSLALQEIAYACASTAVTMSVANLSTEPLLHFGNREQQEKYLLPLAAGEKLGAFAITETEAGSDPSSMTTRAEEKDDHYLINGRKIFITNGSYADVINLIARTDPQKGNRGLSAFLIEKGMPGFTIGKREEKMGLHASDTVELVFDDCRVPKRNLLGKKGQGFKVAMVALDSGRIGIASQSLGIARACLDEAVNYSQDRRQFGKAICSLQAIQWMIADMATQIEAAYWLVLSAANRKDMGVPFTREASMAKLFASELANRAAYKALQIHGGYGYISEFKIERLFRDARVTTIYEGTSEVQRIVIARETMNK
ncbi:MAG: acyl-CoA dehydrogenase family protein [Thermodesulfobacteriota bacterium]|nr:acyl-CoA dehydrogenase family protein [Thermodesulfobacteriota bacterium]